LKSGGIPEARFAPNRFRKNPCQIFYFPKKFLYLLYNQLKKNKMEKTLNVVFGIWAWTLGLTVVIAIAFAIVQVATGNYSGTASFEF